MGLPSLFSPMKAQFTETSFWGGGWMGYSRDIITILFFFNSSLVNNHSRWKQNKVRECQVSQLLPTTVESRFVILVLKLILRQTFLFSFFFSILRTFVIICFSLLILSMFVNDPVRFGGAGAVQCWAAAVGLDLILCDARWFILQEKSWSYSIGWWHR